VVEKLLGPRNSGRLGGFNYGVPGERLEGTHQLSSVHFYSGPNLTGRIPLLKLHGSLNWSIDGTKWVDTRNSRKPQTRALILPPGGSEKPSLLRPVWSGASEVLLSSEVAVVCGYSFPDYDEDVRNLLRKFGQNLKRIVIMDLDGRRIVTVLQKLLGDRPQLICGPPINERLTSRDMTKALFNSARSSPS
jgi:hypothetical protein